MGGTLTRTTVLLRPASLRPLWPVWIPNPTPLTHPNKGRGPETRGGMEDRSNREGTRGELQEEGKRPEEGKGETGMRGWRTVLS